MSFSIDSLKLRLPLSKVKLLNSELADTWVTAKLNTDTGEIVYDDNKTFKGSSYSIEQDGIKTKYLIEKVNTGRGVKEYCCILFNSKLLKQRYFEGITRNNIKDVYNALMSHNAINVDFNVFLSSACTDTDFKKDYYVGNILQVLNDFEKLTISSKDSRRGVNLYNKKDNRGIEWGKRKTATPGIPFIKFYDKKRELEYNSTEFYEKYIKDNKNVFKEDKELIRVEYTIKGKKHLQSFSKTGIIEKILPDGSKERYCYEGRNTLSNYLNMFEEVKQYFMISVLNKHIDNRKIGDIMGRYNIEQITGDLEQDLSYSDIILLNNMKYYLSIEGNTITDFFLMCVQGFSSSPKSRAAKSKWKKKILELHQYHLGLSEEQAKADQSTIDFIEQLGLL